MEPTKHTKHNKKRKMIGISLYYKEQQIMKEKYGFILNATQAKNALLEGEVTIITQNEDPVLTETITQLRKIGNNINQLAHLANAKNEVPAELVLMNNLSELRKIIFELRKSR